MELMNRLNAHTSKMMRPQQAFFPEKYRRLRAISFCATRQMPPSPSGSVWMMNVSITAEKTQSMHSLHIKSPQAVPTVEHTSQYRANQACQRAHNIHNPHSQASAALAQPKSGMLAPVPQAGMRPECRTSRSRTAISSGTRGVSAQRQRKQRDERGSGKSSTTMMLRLFTCPTMSPTGESTTMGRKLPAETKPQQRANRSGSNKYSGNCKTQHRVAEQR